MRAPSAVVEAQLANCFEAWGRVVARHPCAILWSSIVFALILAGGITQIQIVGDAEQLWAVRDRGWRDEQFLRECCGRPATSIAIQAVRMGGGSIFEPEAMLEVLRVHEWVTQTLQITRSDGSLAGYAELCDRSGDQCSALLPTASLLGMAFNYSSSNVPSSEAAILMAVNAINEQWPIQQQVAEPAIDPSTGLVTSSRGIMLRYALFEFESEDDVTFALAVDGITPTGERTGTGVTSVADPALLEITHWSEAGIDVEFARTVAQDIPLFVVALNLVVRRRASKPSPQPLVNPLADVALAPTLIVRRAPLRGRHPPPHAPSYPGALSRSQPRPHAPDGTAHPRLCLRPLPARVDEYHQCAARRRRWLRRRLRVRRHLPQRHRHHAAHRARRAGRRLHHHHQLPQPRQRVGGAIHAELAAPERGPPPPPEASPR